MSKCRVTIQVDRENQNRQGAQIVDFSRYFDELIRRAGYVEAASIVQKRFNISVFIKDVLWQ